MKKKVAIIGGGASALLLAAELDPTLFEVCIYEKNTAAGRKFLVAGEGGFNLSHSEEPSLFLNRYTPAGFLEKAFTTFNNQQLISWLEAAGIPTYVGSSGRVFPLAGMKPIDVLNVFLELLKQKGVSFQYKTEWTGFSPDKKLLMRQHDEQQTISCDLVVFCLGGASWPVTGSTGDWAQHFSSLGITVNPFEASNCAYQVNWPAAMVPLVEGKPLKNCRISCGDKSHAGEITLTAQGIEGSGIYPLSPQIRQTLHENGRARIFIDLKPSLAPDFIVEKIKKSRTNKSFSKYLSESLNINPVQMALLKNLVSKEDFLDPVQLATHIKNLKLDITGSGALADAISTVGGIDLEEIDDNFELKKLPSHFVIGEMLDYDAPTGGYLLQSCFSMAMLVAKHLNGA